MEHGLPRTRRLAAPPPPPQSLGPSAGRPARPNPAAPPPRDTQRPAGLGAQYRNVPVRAFRHARTALESGRVRQAGGGAASMAQRGVAGTGSGGPSPGPGGPCTDACRRVPPGVSPPTRRRRYRPGPAGSGKGGTPPTKADRRAQLGEFIHPLLKRQLPTRQQ